MFLKTDIDPSESPVSVVGNISLLSIDKDSGECPRIGNTKIVYSSSNACLPAGRELLSVYPEHIQRFRESLQTFPKHPGILPENMRTYPPCLPAGRELMRSFPENMRIFPENTRSFPENVRISPENTCLPAGTVRHSDENACQTDRILYVNNLKPNY